MKRLKLTLISLAALIGVAAMVPAYASADAIDDAQSGVRQIGGDDGSNDVKLENRFQDVVNIILFVLGAIAVIMIIVGGIRYVVSAGDTSAMTNAKNTILYAVIGLVIAILAYAIVNFVIESFT